MRSESKIGLVAKYKDKYWGIKYKDGHCTSWGWVDLEYADISDPRYCRTATDKTYADSPYIKELEKAHLVTIEQVITRREL